MPSIEFSQDDFNFLAEQAEKAGMTVEEYVGFMVDRQRVIVKYPPGSKKAVEKPKSTLEPPHRKWGM